MKIIATKKKIKNQNGKSDSCKVICFNVKKVNDVKRSLPTEKEFEELTGLMRRLEMLLV